MRLSILPLSDGGQLRSAIPGLCRSTSRASSTTWATSPCSSSALTTTTGSTRAECSLTSKETKALLMDRPVSTRPSKKVHRMTFTVTQNQHSCVDLSTPLACRGHVSGVRESSRCYNLASVVSSHVRTTSQSSRLEKLVQCSRLCCVCERSFLSDLTTDVEISLETQSLLNYVKHLCHRRVVNISHEEPYSCFCVKFFVVFFFLNFFCCVLRYIWSTNNVVMVSGDTYPCIHFPSNSPPFRPAT